MKNSLRNTIVAGTVAAGLLASGGIAFAQSATTTPTEQGADTDATGRSADREAHRAEQTADLATRLTPHLIDDGAQLFVRIAWPIDAPWRMPLRERLHHDAAVLLYRRMQSARAYRTQEMPRRALWKIGSGPAAI